MADKKTSLFSNGLIWFGAGISIAEIITGTYFAQLGFKKGIAAIIVGHIIGCFMLFLSGIIGGVKRKSSMEAVGSSFGYKGSILFSVLNVIQLAGWTSIMIYDGAVAANRIMGVGMWIWCIIIGILIILWITIGINNLGKLNSVAMAALFVLTIWLCKYIFTGNSEFIMGKSAMTFGAAVELAVAMPLSWLPLISDYTREAEKPFKATVVSVIIYGLTSTWMYIIGMAAVIYTGKGDIASVIIKAGSGIAGLLIIIFSTVTTTFMDAFSAGVSMQTIYKSFKSKFVGIFVTILGVILASIYPMDDITDFLYFIGSAFAPMIAIQIADYFIFKNDFSNKRFNMKNIIIWFLGFILYRILMHVDIFLGNTLPDMILTILMYIVVSKCNFIKKVRSE